MKWLVAVSIGPVQEFIAAARRTRDLYLGSKLLSNVVRAMAHEVVERGGSLIFPALDVEGSPEAGDPAGSNKLLFELEGEPSIMVRAAREAAVRQVDSHAKHALKHATENGALVDEESFWAQVRGFIEIYAAWVSSQPGNSYREQRGRLDQLLAARKSTRDFAPVTWGAGVPKSTITGQLEGVLRLPPSDEAAVRARLQLSEGEELSAVDMVKRFGGDEHFPSTSWVAALPFQRWAAKENPAAVRRFVAGVERFARESGLPDERLSVSGLFPGEAWAGLAGEWLYPERVESEAALRGVEAKASLTTNLEPLFRELKGTRPGTYYGVLTADGDSMGRWLDEVGTDASTHREASKRLAGFARRVKDALGSSASLVYRGGDEVLALVALDRLLDAATALRAAFTEETRRPDQIAPTISVGIAICHHLEPLQDCLALARETLKVAKERYKKDSLALCLSKHSGSTVTIGGKWGEFVPRIREWTSLFGRSALPRRLAHELFELDALLGKWGGVEAAVAAEVQRIVGRKRAERGVREIGEGEKAKLKDAVGRIGSTRLADELVVAAFIAEGGVVHR